MAKKKPCKRCGKKACKPVTVNAPPLSANRVWSDPVSEVPKPLYHAEVIDAPPPPAEWRVVPDTPKPTPSAFWRPILRKPRWDWLGAAILILFFCLIATCRPAKGDVRVDVAGAAGVITVDVGRDGVDVGLSRATPRTPHVPWWIRGHYWGPPHWRHYPHHEHRGHQHGGRR